MPNKQTNNSTVPNKQTNNSAVLNKQTNKFVSFDEPKDLSCMVVLGIYFKGMMHYF